MKEKTFRSSSYGITFTGGVFECADEAKHYVMGLDDPVQATWRAEDDSGFTIGADGALLQIHKATRS